ncbi:hypothetical protein FA13DRAFT_1733771 [Coprinellus micaceus]|uniref:Uncharacterized protein n=1 Tax=Coprinellus micaceus TaxID=71717 RepID=A0A4Y7T8G1_COPMI|nr:hypothetical protein FA13DRAFT_1733771 [Coprinellus micaceus]
MPRHKSKSAELSKLKQSSIKVFMRPKAQRPQSVAQPTALGDTSGEGPIRFSAFLPKDPSKPLLRMSSWLEAPSTPAGEISDVPLDPGGLNHPEAEGAGLNPGARGRGNNPDDAPRIVTIKHPVSIPVTVRFRSSDEAMIEVPGTVNFDLDVQVVLSIEKDKDNAVQPSPEPDGVSALETIALGAVA